MEGDHGVWTLTVDSCWNPFYLYEVEVYDPSVRGIVRNLVTDPYSRSLSRNSAMSQVIRMDDPELMPEGWATTEKPPLEAPEDIVLYELHVRDFSASDPEVPEPLRGTFMAFTLDTPATRHLRSLAEAGLTHVHLLPSFDIATVNEDRSTWKSPGDLSQFPSDSPEQQAAVSAIRSEDGYNWGYDPYHYGVPEGSYSTDPDGPARVLEFRRMVQALSNMGLRVVMDVVYNHTHASGRDHWSVLDRVVPGYYHRLNADGAVENSTCCANTATEHAMMERLMIDDLVHWARDYKVDGFRFDLMGHHMKRNMVAAREALDALTLEKDGVDGTKIYLYGEGWDFGEVAQGKRGVNATQANLAGTGIGTFNDRIRDAVRGGNPFNDRREQGFATGLFTAPNGFNGAGAAERARLLETMDRIRVGMAGNLAGYRFTDRNGAVIRGGELAYGGYTADPQETINYASAHDNETLYDKIQLAAPAGATRTERIAMQEVALAVIALGQGIPFFHAGSEMLRSKSMDADSYDSGDWFNRLDTTYATNNFGVGLPPAEKNRDRWALMGPLLARDDLKPAPEEIGATAERFRVLMRVRRSSPLFRLRTAQDIQERVRFLNTGPDQIPGLIVMEILDEGDGRADLDPRQGRILVVLNAAPGQATFRHPALKGVAYEIHRDLAGEEAPGFDSASGSLTILGRSEQVWVERHAR
jgi:pullulanase